MGLFSKLIETKYCDVCGEVIPFAGGKKLANGVCCSTCIDMLSPYFSESQRRSATVEDIKYQIACRNHSKKLLDKFDVTRKIGLATKVFIDEDKGLFYVLPSAKNKKTKEFPDVLECKSVTNIAIDIVEHKEEMKYRDSNGELKRFNPPCFACSYDFFLDIDIKTPYINYMRIKLNDSRVNNGQEKVLNLNDGSLLSRFTDAFLPAKSYKGKTSNADEVKESNQYRMYESMARDIRDTILNFHRSKNSRKKCFRVCPWCNMNVLDEQLNCDHCGGPLT